jgi:hypothetical protein
MSSRLAVCAVLFACAFALEGQQNMFKLELAGKGTTATAVSLDEPKLVGDFYVFQAWPDGASVKIPKASVKKMTRLTGKSTETVYQIDLNPSGLALARDLPMLKNGLFVFHTWRAGTLTSVRKADVRRITPLTGEQAFWAEQRQNGEANIGGNFAMEGTNKVISLGTPPGGSSQAGPGNASDLGRGAASSGISGAPQGNWLYQGTPGVSDAYAPANATMSGGVPTMPAATDGSAPPTQPQP